MNESIVKENIVNFVAIDVETANRDIGSICQIGLAKYADGKLIDSYCTLVNPQSYFNERNIEIHGITSDMVLDAPLITDIYNDILAFIDDNIVVSHTYFDQRAISQCFLNYRLTMPKWPWVDATVLVRRTYRQFAVRGYNLANVCKALNYQFIHHDALADAKACGFITTTILNETNTAISDWLKDSPSNRNHRDYRNNRNNRNYRNHDSHNSYHSHHSNSSYQSQPRANQQNYLLDNKSYPSISAKEGDATGQYAGLNICFTGILSISREDIIEIAAKNGFTVKSGASKKLDYLVVGTQDLTLLRGAEKSSKQRKVEALIESGVAIQMIEERAFLRLLGIDIY